MKLAGKIICCQLILLLLILGNGLNSLRTATSIGVKVNTIKQEVIKNQQLMAALKLQISSIQNHTKAYFLSSSVDEQEILTQLYQTFNDNSQVLVSKNSKNEETVSAFKALNDDVTNYRQEEQALDKILKVAPNPTIRRAILGQKLKVFVEIENKIVAGLSVLDQQFSVLSQKQFVAINLSTTRQANLTALLMGISIAAAILLSLLLTRSVLTPIRRTTSILQSNLSEEGSGKALPLKRRDEIGAMVRALHDFSEDLHTEVLQAFEKLADGNFSHVGKGIIEDPLDRANRMLSDFMANIKMAADRFSLASEQVSKSSQALAYGATEQASSVQQTTSAMALIAANIEQSSQHAIAASKATQKVQTAASSGNQQMQEMVTAMAEINAAGENVSRIIKVIDEIAFQTNLLALNAAVEAARAGQHGKGFAVVAEEVRNLAARSAKAAEETSVLIEGSVAKTTRGVEIAQITSATFEDIVAGIGQGNKLVGHIASASEEQAKKISSVNQGLSKIESITLQNTATAEQSAASSEELASQAAELHHMLSHFTLK